MELPLAVLLMRHHRRPLRAQTAYGGLDFSGNAASTNARMHTHILSLSEKLRLEKYIHYKLITYIHIYSHTWTYTI